MSKHEDFEKLNLKELWEFWIKDWAQDEPKLEDMNTMRLWSEATYEAIRKATLLELIESEHIAEAEVVDYVEEYHAVREAIYKHICGSLEERVGTIERSVKLLLKEHENEQATITVGQLNRLKGGV